MRDSSLCNLRNHEGWVPHVGVDELHAASSMKAVHAVARLPRALLQEGSSVGYFPSETARSSPHGLRNTSLGKYAGVHLTLRGTLKASEMPMMVLVSKPGGRFTDCKR
jgi:hypothetical protein